MIPDSVSLSSVQFHVSHNSTLLLCTADKKTSHSEEPSDEEVEYDDDEDHGPSFYDKSKSFFDNISCDATEKAQG